MSGLIKFSYPDASCYVVDDFKDQWYSNKLIDYLKDKGVIFLNKDSSIDTKYISEIKTKGEISVISSLHSIEHWHFSPANFLNEAFSNISYGGKLILAFPNNSNLKKRLLAILGKTQWSKFEYWFDNNYFRGHVREPNISDLELISKKLGCKKKKIYGRNFIANFSPYPLVRVFAKMFDLPLRFFPAYCGDLYLIMYKL